MTDSTLRQACGKYIDYLREQGKSVRTLYTYAKDLEQVQAFFGSEKPVSSITLPMVGKFLKSDELQKLLNGENRANPTVQKTIRVFRTFIFWSHNNALIDHLPLPQALAKGRGLYKAKGDPKNN